MLTLRSMSTLFLPLFLLCIAQRLFELRRSARNQRMLRESGFELREKPKPLGVMVALHIAWFVAMLVESILWPVHLPAVALPAAALFLAAQLLRIWVLRTLGVHWNVSVMAPAGSVEAIEPFVTAGPYRFVRHPNYLAVIIEFATLPLVGGAPLTALVFSVLNLLVLRTRIALEERHLFSRPGYREAMGGKARLVPGVF